MTVEELINELSKLPNNTEVIVKEDGGIGRPILTYANKFLFIESEEK